jgi:phosphoribosylanthranilate isomerase
MPLRIKICGVTRPEDVDLAVELGADAVGLNFYPHSPRYVDEERAVRLVRALPPLITPVGVFVEPTIDQLSFWWNRLGVRTFQVHALDPGSLAPTFAAMSWSVILAHAVTDEDSLEHLLGMVRDWRTGAASIAKPAVLVDALVPGKQGGTGQTVPWRLLQNFDPGVPLILAGGLTPENVAEAVRTVHPFGIDVASGVERSPGIKDAAKMKRFVENARSAC